MPYMMSFERIARKQELLAGIEQLLELKFGPDGLQLLPEIRQVSDIDVLRAVLQSVKTAAAPDDLRRLWTPGGQEQPLPPGQV
jgi:hypothetical protein